MIIDRFEGDYAIVEMSNGEYVDILKSEFPTGAKEGDYISLVIDQNKTREKKEKIDELVDELWED